MEDNTLTQLMIEPTRARLLLDWLFTNREGLVDMWWSEAAWDTVTMK